MDIYTSAFTHFFAFSVPDISVTAPSLGAVVALVLAILLLLLSAFASGSEIAFFSLSSKDMEELAEEKSMRDKRLLQLIAEPERLLATILIVNDFVNVGIVMLLNFFFMSVLEFGPSAQWLEFVLLTVLLTFLLLLFGEVMPKIYSKSNVLKFARFSATGFYLLSRILSPFSKLLVRSTLFAQRLVSKKSHLLSVDELEQALELTDNKEIGEQNYLSTYGDVDFKTKGTRVYLSFRF